MATRPIVCRTPTPDYPPRGAAVLSVAGYEYGPYGEVVREDGWYAAHNRIGYRGQYRERVAGVASDELVYHGYRYYSPRQGRFINRDPIGEAGGSNGYGYVWNDPVNRIDWLGLRGVWHGAGFEGGGSGQEDEPESADAAAISRVVERGRLLVSRVFGRWDVFPAIERVLAQGEVTAKQSTVAGQERQSRQQTKEEVHFFTVDEYYPVNDGVLARFGGAAKLLEKFGDYLSQLDHIDSRTGNSIKQFLGLEDTITPVLQYGRETYFVNADHVFGGTRYAGSSAITIYGPADIANSPTLQSFMQNMGARDPLQYNRIVKVRHYTEVIWREPGE
jgi:RHS repeat-associated protein